MFAVFAAVAVPVWRRLAQSNSAASASNPFLNRRADALVGRVFTLEKPIIDGSGTVRIDDTIWRVAGPDAPAGSRVKDRAGRRRQPDGGGGVVRHCEREAIQRRSAELDSRRSLLATSYRPLHLSANDAAA